MKILLTACHIQMGPEAFPLAQLLLKKYCEESSMHNISIEIYEFYLSSSIDEVIKTILNKNIDILGIGVYLWNSDYYIELSKKLKQLRPELIIVAGGPETRLNYSNFLKIIDFTIQGEGEHVFLQLIDKIKTKSNNKIYGLNTGDNQYIKDLNLLPSPYIDNDINYTKYDGILWELSRGCPFSCSFCFESKGIQGVRYYPIEKISKELYFFTKTDIKQIFVLDPTFNTDLERAKKILNLIIKTKTRIHFHFEIRAEFIDEELAVLFSKINCSIQIGIQSSNVDALNTVNRNLNPHKFKEKINILSNYNLAFGLDLIYGLPNDTFSGFKNSMEYVLNLQPNHLDIFPLSILPGTKLYDQATELKLVFNNSPPYSLISNETYTEKMMSDSARLAKSCDFIFNKCKSTGWLMQVCEELEITQVDFIDKFSLFIFDYDSSNPVIYLKSFIEKEFSKGNISLVLDIINYHWSYSTALASPGKHSNIKLEKLKSSVPVIIPNTTLVKSEYNILDAFENGLYYIKEIKQIYTPDKNRYITWYDDAQGVLSESFRKEFMDFLFNIDNIKTVNEINPKIDSSFLEYAQSTSMIYFK